MALATPDLPGSTAVITGTTRGIGKQLALADPGCDVVSTGKTTGDDDSELDGPIEQTAREVRDHGAEALALEPALRDEDRVEAVVEEAIDRFARSTSSSTTRAPSSRRTSRTCRPIDSISCPT